MPNWCDDILTIHGPEEDLEKFRAKLRTLTDDTPRLSFDALHPMPEEEEDNWHEWRLVNWGTKWDITDNELGELPSSDSPGLLEYGFSTAWSPPIALVQKLNEDFPSLTFRLVYAEPGVCFAGMYEAKGDEIITEEEYTSYAAINSIGEDFFGVTYYDEDDLLEEEED